jgi:TolB protein
VCTLFSFEVIAEDLVIKIEKGVSTALPIAIVPFENKTGEPLIDPAAIIRNNLERSGLFKSLPVNDMPALPSTLEDVRKKNWTSLGIENLVIGKLVKKKHGTTDIHFRLIDVYSGKQLLGYRIPVRDDDLRFGSHKVSDFIYEKLLDKPGAYTSLLAYITVDQGLDSDTVYRLQVSDSDGHNARTILQSTEPIVSPAWSPDGQRLAYVSFERNNSAIYLQDLATGRRERIIHGKGINSSPAFSGDGNKLAVTLSRDGNPEIYLYDFKSKSLTRVTRHGAIDTEPAWAPDGRGLVFTSDRGDGPQIYYHNLADNSMERITYNMGRYNTRARYSPDGRKLVLVNGAQGNYRIVLFDLQTKIYEAVTIGVLDESPSFSPNGAMIIYATVTKNGSQLAAVSADGFTKQKLVVQRGEVREPVWGPLIR